MPYGFLAIFLYFFQNKIWMGKDRTSRRARTPKLTKEWGFLVLVIFHRVGHRSNAFKFHLLFSDFVLSLLVGLLSK